MAAESRCGTLVVTHLYPGSDPEAVMEGIGRLYSGPIVVAEDRMRLPVV
jgi:ribonuclease BN (tRNA processing enzyme)